MDLSSRLQRYLCSTVKQQRHRPPVAANRLAWLKPQSGAEGRPSNLLYGAACYKLQKLHPSTPFIIITQPESWYLFYHPTEGRSCSVFLCFDTTAQQQRDRSSPNLHRKLSLWCCSLMVLPPWKLVPWKVSGFITSIFKPASVVLSVASRYALPGYGNRQVRVRGPGWPDHCVRL